MLDCATILLLLPAGLGNNLHQFLWLWNSFIENCWKENDKTFWILGYFKIQYTDLNVELSEIKITPPPNVPEITCY